MQTISEVPGLVVQRFDFKTSVQKTLSTFGYRFLSVIADGVINPLVNYPGPLVLFEQDFYLLWQSGDRLLVNGEIHNFPVYNNDKVELIYQAYSGGNATLQGGYGFFYVILHNDPLPFARPVIDPPSLLISDASFPGMTTKNYWAGTERTDSGYASVIPYVPMGFDKLSYTYYSNSTDHSLKIYEYPRGQDNDAKEVLNITASGAGDAELLGSGRYRIELKNNAGSVKIFRLWLTYKRGFAWCPPP